MVAVRELVVLSGKGGVGKTTFTASLATLLSGNLKLTLADVDVDAPNVALVLGGREVARRRVRAMERAHVDYGACDGCGSCRDSCPMGALIWVDSLSRPAIFGMMCEGCGSCAVACPKGAIRLEPAVNGSIVEVDTDAGIPLIFGEVEVGFAGSGELVSEVKARAREVARSNGSDLLLVDGPPGIGCAAIAAVSGATDALLVTEPSQTALHDLERSLRLVRHFGLEGWLVLNKVGMSPTFEERVRQYAESGGVRLVGEVPLDPSVPRAITQGLPVVKAYPDSPASRALRELASFILSELEGGHQ